MVVGFYESCEKNRKNMPGMVDKSVLAGNFDRQCREWLLADLKGFCFAGAGTILDSIAGADDHRHV